jgi:hypothetical protein
MMRRVRWTDDTFALVKKLTAENVPSDEIARRFGCSLGSLRVNCSKKKVSLRTPNWQERQRNRLKAVWQTVAVFNDRPVEPKAEVLPPLPVPCIVDRQFRPKPVKPYKPLPLSRVALSLLRQQADLRGLTETALATRLLEAIAQNNLYDAVLQNDTAQAA